MSPLSRKAEIEAIESAHRAAQARLGLAAAYVSLAMWRTVSASNPRATAQTWLTNSNRAAYAARRKSTALARAYYQLVRALETNRTLGRPDGATGPVTLEQLRKRFQELLLDAATINSERGTSGDPDEKWFEDELKALTKSGEDENARSVRMADTELDSYVQDLLDATDNDNRTIGVDPFTWPRDLTLDETGRVVQRALLNKAVVSQEKKLKAFADRAARDAGKALQQMEAEHMRSGSAGAGLIDQFGLSGGRFHIDYAATNDRLVKMIARGLGPNPCAFCAMLASRGFQPAATNGTFWGHDNCHCYPIVAFKTTRDERPENAYYQALWQDKIAPRRLSAKAALNEWRKLLHDLNREREAQAKKLDTPTT